MVLCLLRFALRVGATLAPLPLLVGCMVLTSNPDYPSEWAPHAAARVDGCPRIAGRYLNDGELHVTSGATCMPQSQMPKGSEAGSWDCRQQLVANLGLTGEAAVVELKQPDEQTLEVALQDGAGNTLATHRLQRGHGFHCDADSLFFSGTRSMLGGPGLTAVGILFLSGGVNNHSRAFSATTDGTLVMTVRERWAMYHLVFGAAHSSTSYVRWPVAPAAPASAASAP